MGTHPIFESDFDCLTEMKCEILEKVENGVRCPICRQMRDDIHALKYHLKVAHKKNKREIDDLVELGTMEIEPKRQKMSISKSIKTEPPAQIEKSKTRKPAVQAPILPSTMVEDESHFLLSRSITNTLHVKQEIQD